MQPDITHIKTETLQFIEPAQAWHYQIIPAQLGNTIVFYTHKTSDENTREELEIIFGKPVTFIPIEKDVLSKYLSKYYRKNTEKRTALTAIDEKEDFLMTLINEAYTTRSSDIHLEATDKKCRVRFRIDGKLIERFVIQKKQYPELINKVKIKANLDIAEKRLPQDGRIVIKNSETKLDLRVSILPTLYGEKVVMRLLGADAAVLSLQELGMQKEQLNLYLSGASRANGIILISGPTGSGKTTTLYATLNYLNKIDKNITTIEDPIEYTLEGINQVQLNTSIGLTFPKALRTFLRQDPDIIMVGEIRDKATAEMAIRASLTGHLVLSTIHTNSAWGTINRLIDMDIPPFLISDTLNLSVAQRLVRLLCPHCKKKTNEAIQTHGTLFTEPTFEPTGCDQCYYTGYKGRRAVYEIIDIDDVLKNQIKQSHIGIKPEKTYTTLKDQVVKMVQSGETSLHEVYPILM